MHRLPVRFTPDFAMIETTDGQACEQRKTPMDRAVDDHEVLVVRRRRGSPGFIGDSDYWVATDRRCVHSVGLVRVAFPPG